MGVQYLVACNDCKEWIDIQKSYTSSSIHFRLEPHTWDEAMSTRQGLIYHVLRYAWFLSKHIKHDVTLHNDCEDEDGEGYWHVYKHQGWKELFPFKDEQKRGIK